MDRPHGRGNDQEFKGKRAPRRPRASHWISVRSRGSALRYRHRRQTVRRKRRYAFVAHRILERLEDVNGSAGGNSKQPRLALGTWHLALSESAENTARGVADQQQEPSAKS